MNLATTHTYDFPSNAEKTVFAWSRLVGRFPSQISAFFLVALARTWSVKDPLNRLTNESISNAVSGPNGATSYGYDSINRLSWSSNLPNVPNASPTYDPDDRRTSDENFDPNGSTINTGGHSYTYDAEGKLIGVDNGAITLTYDGDGNLISKANSTTGKTETFLIDTANPTGYAQIVETQVNRTLANVFNFGPSGIISQGNVASGRTAYFGKDGANSTRYLMDQSGNVTDTFDYSADGILVNRTGSTPTYNLFQSEHYVPDMGLYWLRARWMNPQVGEFMTMDSYEGDQEDPASLHKYAFVQWDGGVDLDDPSGNDSQNGISGFTDKEFALINGVEGKAIPPSNYSAKVATVFYWEPADSSESGTGTKSVGHISITLSDKITHISLFPVRDASLIRKAFHAHPEWEPDLMTDEDGGHEGRPPTKEFLITGLDEDAIRLWWPNYRASVTGWSLVGDFMSNWQVQAFGVPLSSLNGLHDKVCTQAVEDTLRQGGRDFGEFYKPQTLATELMEAGF